MLSTPPDKLRSFRAWDLAGSEAVVIDEALSEHALADRGMLSAEIDWHLIPKIPSNLAAAKLMPERFVISPKVTLGYCSACPGDSVIAES
jgi:hypothetical protein